MVRATFPKFPLAPMAPTSHKPWPVPRWPSQRPHRPSRAQLATRLRGQLLEIHRGSWRWNPSHLRKVYATHSSCVAAQLHNPCAFPAASCYPTGLRIAFRESNLPPRRPPQSGDPCRFAFIVIQMTLLTPFLLSACPVEKRIKSVRGPKVVALWDPGCYTYSSHAQGITPVPFVWLRATQRPFA